MKKFLLPCLLLLLALNARADLVPQKIENPPPSPAPVAPTPPAPPPAPCKEPVKKTLTVGMKVVAQWMGDNWWVAKVMSIKGENVDVTYTDGEKATRKKSLVIPHPEVQNAGGLPPCLKPGDRIVAKWRNDSWWLASVDKIEGNKVDMTYSDNTKGIQKITDLVRLP